MDKIESMEKKMNELEALVADLRSQVHKLKHYSTESDAVVEFKEASLKEVRMGCGFSVGKLQRWSERAKRVRQLRPPYFPLIPITTPGNMCLPFIIERVLTRISCLYVK
jgi:predicted RNase H-like nuclease (RuvC/YqgF family)